MKKSKESIKTVAQTAAYLSEALHFLNMSLSWLAHDETYAERIKPDMGYLESVCRAVKDRTKCVFDNIRLHKPLNQYEENKFSELISYENYISSHVGAENFRRMKATVDKARKPWKPEPSSIGKVLREWRGNRYSLYAIAKECGCRAEGLQRIEEGKDVTTTNLMHYIHFIKEHDPDSLVLIDIWKEL